MEEYVARLLPPRLMALVRGAAVGIDLGTSTTFVYVQGKGIVVREPSVVALNEKTGTVVAVGRRARAMLGRAPQHLRVVRPVLEGVISEYDVAEELLRHLLDEALGARRGGIFGPRVVVGVPTGITTVEIRAVREAARAVGAREVCIVEEPVAAALGIRLPVEEARGSMVIDIGGGTTDLAILSLGGVVESRSLRVAGDTFDQAIATYLREELGILVGERTAEEVKWEVGAATPLTEPRERIVRGRDVARGLPKEVAVTDSDVREALTPHLERIAEAARELVEVAPPEVVADLMSRGAYLVGGGALLRGIAPFFAERLGMHVEVAPDPLTAVVRGTARVLEQPEAYRAIIVTHDEEPLAQG